MTEDIKDFYVTFDQYNAICACFGYDATLLEEWDVCELIDKALDNYVYISNRLQ